MSIARHLPRRLLASVAVACVVGGPLTVDFASAQDEEIESLREEREAGRREAAEVAAQLDALAAEDDDLVAGIETLDSYIGLQEALVSDAEQSIADAERLAEEAQAEVDAIAGESALVRKRLQIAAVNAFVAPDIDALEQLDATDLLQSEIKQSYIGEVLGDEYELIDELRQLGAASDAAVRRADEAAADAEAERVEMAGRLDELAVARVEVEKLRTQVAARVDEWEDVGAVIEAADDVIADQIRQLEADLARQAAEAEAAAEAERVRQAEEEAARIAEEAANAEAPEDVATADDEEAQESPAAPPANSGPFSVTHRPVPGWISSSYGTRVHPVFGTVRNHYGVDLHASRGDAIGAAAAGTVLSAGWMNGYGNTVVISHGDGFTTLYAHQSSIAVSSGQAVSGGQTVGYVGDTGWATGPHLHFEIRINGAAVNPASYL